MNRADLGIDAASIHSEAINEKQQLHNSMGETAERVERSDTEK